MSEAAESLLREMTWLSLPVAACRRTPTRVEKYEPTTDPGIELAAFVDRDWNGKRPRPVLSYEMGKYDEGWSGFHVDSDGTIWAFGYDAPSGDSERCNVAELTRGSAEFDACLYSDSTLAARLTGAELGHFTRSAANLADEGRLKGGGLLKDGGGLSLLIQRHGMGKDESIAVARCSPREQLTTNEARYFIALFHRITRAVPRFFTLNPTCGSRHLGNEIVPGVPGWWVR